MTELTYVEQVRKATDFISSHLSETPELAVVLGSGLGEFVKKLKDKQYFLASEIPHYPVSTAPSHQGKIIVGKLDQKLILCFSGRLHFYEGHTMHEVTFPIRIIGELGIKKVILTNAAGGTSEDMQAGDFVFIRDHINLHPVNPLRGTNHSTWGVRFPDMSDAYSPSGLTIARAACAHLNLPFKTGIYVGLQGPNLETPAEYQFINRIGGDLVGMSTVPEVIVARHMRIEVIGISLVTNACYPPDLIRPTTIEDVLQLASDKSELFTDLLSEVIKEF